MSLPAPFLIDSPVAGKYILPNTTQFHMLTQDADGSLKYVQSGNNFQMLAGKTYVITQVIVTPTTTSGIVIPGVKIKYNSNSGNILFQATSQSETVIQTVTWIPIVIAANSAAQALYADLNSNARVFVGVLAL